MSVVLASDIDLDVAVCQIVSFLVKNEKRIIPPKVAMPKFFSISLDLPGSSTTHSSTFDQSGKITGKLTSTKPEVRDLRTAKIAASRLVELLEILNAGMRVAEVRSCGRPSSLANDELLVTNDSFGVGNGLLEDTLSGINLSTLPVRERIHNDNLFQLIQGTNHIMRE